MSWKYIPEYVQIRMNDCSDAELQLRPHLVFILVVFYFLPMNASG